MGLREIGERVGLNFSAVGNAVQRTANNPAEGAAIQYAQTHRDLWPLRNSPVMLEGMYDNSLLQEIQEETTK